MEARTRPAAASGRRFAMDFAADRSPSAAEDFSRRALRQRLAAQLHRHPLSVTIASTYAIIVLVLLPQEFVQDTWLTLVGGRAIADHGLPHHDHLTVMWQGASWVDQQWLGKLLFYAAWGSGGLVAVATLHVIAVLGAFIAAFAVARRCGASDASVFWAGVATLGVAPWSWQARTQVLAYPLFVALLALLSAHGRRPTRWVFATIPILVVWANVHGSVTLGAALVALAGCAFAVQEWRSYERYGDWKLHSVLLITLPWLCVFASPYGNGLIGYYRDLLFNPYMKAFIGEWRPTTFPSGALFYGLVAASTALVARYGTRLTLFERLALLATAMTGFMAVRGMVWFVLCALMFVPRLLDAWKERALTRTAASRLSRRLAALALGGALAAGVVDLALPARPQGFPSKATAVVDEVARTHPHLQVFASERYADWLLWKDPHLAGRLAFDVRFELARAKDFRNLVAFHDQLGSSPNWITRNYRMLVLDRITDKRAESALLRESGTRLLYQDKHVSVILRRP